MKPWLALAWISLALCPAQQGPLATFGTTVVIPGGLTGKIYPIPNYSTRLPKFEKIEPVGTIYTKGVFIPLREFSEGFPGITDRIEWFAIDFNGRIYIDNPGNYRFNLCSDDGSILYLDGKTVINNDGIHSQLCEQGGVKLSGGIHELRLSYFQGPRFHLSLMLSVLGPDDKRFRVFNTDEFQPPADPANWKYGTPDSLVTPGDPDIGRVRLRDTLRRPDPMVTLSVQVVAQGRPVRDLKPSDFLVRDEADPQQITDLAFAKQPLDIALLIDASPAMTPIRRRLQSVASKALAQLDRHDRVAIVLFAEKQLLTLGFGSDRNMILAALGKIQILPGAPDVNSAVALTALSLRQHTRPEATHAIVIVTASDGRRGVSDRATQGALWQTRAILSGLLEKADLRPFIDATGGEALELDAKDVPLGEIFRGLRERYSITYRAPGGTSKSVRRVSVELTPEAKARRPDATTRAPLAYVVP